MLWMLFALASTFFWAGTNMFDKVMREKYLKNSMSLTAAFGIVNFPLGILLAFFIGIPSIPTNIFIVAVIAGLAAAYAIIPYIKALSMEEASRVIPLWHLSPLFTLILAVVFLNEILTPISYIAFTSILIGGFLISTRRVGATFHLSPAVVFMLISSLLFSITDVLLKFAYTNSDFWQTFLVFYISIGIGQVSLFAISNVRKDFSKTLKAPHRTIFITLLMIGMTAGFMGYIFFNNAIFRAPVTLVTVFVSFQSLFVLLMATALAVKFHTFRNESFDVKTFGTKLIAITFMAIGIILLAS